jgi:hypothetical protein
MIRAVGIAIVLVSTGIAYGDGAKPLLTGTYELLRFKPADSKEKDVDVGDTLGRGQDGVWGRVLFTFDGPRVTMTIQRLDKDDAGRYEACSTSVTTGVVWSRDGFKIPGEVSAKATAWKFEDLSRTHVKQSANTCEVTLVANTWKVEQGDSPKLKSADGTVTIRKASLDVVWTSVVK